MSNLLSNEEYSNEEAQLLGMRMWEVLHGLKGGGWQIRSLRKPLRQ